MDIEVKRMYDEALKNEEFNIEFKEQDPKGYIKPRIYSQSLLKHLYAMAYFGWLVGKGKFSRDNYCY